MREINDKLDKHYVTSDEFKPVQKIIYALVALILLSFVGGLTALVFKNNSTMDGGNHERKVIERALQP